MTNNMLDMQMHMPARFPLLKHSKAQITEMLTEMSLSKNHMQQQLKRCIGAGLDF